MKFKKYLEALNKLAVNNPSCLKFEVIYSHDDEGNNFQKINNIPEICTVPRGGLKKYLFEEVYFNECECEDEKPNAVCIN